MREDTQRMCEKLANHEKQILKKERKIDRTPKKTESCKEEMSNKMMKLLTRLWENKKNKQQTPEEDYKIQK